MHTEENAREKWCPFTRMVVVTPKEHSVLNTTSYNRAAVDKVDPQEPLLPRACFCIASGCMAWQWEEISTETRTLEVGEQPEPDAMDKGWKTPTTTVFGKVVWKRRRQPTQGYCGLAGKPQ